MHHTIDRIGRTLTFLIADPFALSCLPAPVTQEMAREIVSIPYEHNLDIFSLAHMTASVAAPASFTCGIINAKSGQCQENCAFCAQSAHHAAHTPVHPLLSSDEIVRRAHALAEAGASRFGIVTSGTSLSDAEIDALCPIIARIRCETPLQVCGSIGMLDRQRALRLKEAGLQRYHHNLETAASFFPTICSTHTYAEDIESIQAAREAGLAICCGGIFGMGESWEQRIEFSQTLATLEVDCIPINFLTPIPGTPLAGTALLPPREALRIVSLLRLMHPCRDLVICGGRSTVLGEWDSWVIAAGANGLMTGDYLTTTGSPYERDIRMLTMLGLR